MYIPELTDFPEFSLERLLSTCFGCHSSESSKVCILIDLPDLDLARDKAFLEDVSRFPVGKAYKTFISLQDDTASKLGFEKVDFLFLRLPK